MAARKHDPAQDELALTSVMSHAVFAGRTSLGVGEVAKTLHCTKDHIYDLISEGKIKAVNIGGDPVVAGGTNATNRKFWRIPVSAYDQFVKDNQS